MTSLIVRAPIGLDPPAKIDGSLEGCAAHWQLFKGVGSGVRERSQDVAEFLSTASSTVFAAICSAADKAPPEASMNTTLAMPMHFEWDYSLSSGDLPSTGDPSVDLAMGSVVVAISLGAVIYMNWNRTRPAFVVSVDGLPVTNLNPEDTLRSLMDKVAKPRFVVNLVFGDQTFSPKDSFKTLESLGIRDGAELNFKRAALDDSNDMGEFSYDGLHRSEELRALRLKEWQSGLRLSSSSTHPHHQ